MNQDHKILDALAESDKPSVLATIIHVEGSAYRKEGTSVLITESGERVGMLSGGCLEEDVQERVPSILANGRSQTVVYDMREEDDLSWGKGAGCNGVIHILFEPVLDELREHLRKVRENVLNGIDVTSVKKLDKERTATEYLFIPRMGTTAFGFWKEYFPIEPDAWQSGGSGIRFSTELSAEIFVHTFRPKPRLLIIGAGEDARPLVAIASLAGFSVTISDSRPASCNPIKFPEADSFWVGTPEEIIAGHPLLSTDSVMVMTHQFARDRLWLQWLMQQDLKYLGILGPRHRTLRLLNGLEPPTEVHSPAGVPIGAQGPDEIAISIVAELIRAQRLPPSRKADIS